MGQHIFPFNGYEPCAGIRRGKAHFDGLTGSVLLLFKFQAQVALGQGTGGKVRRFGQARARNGKRNKSQHMAVVLAHCDQVISRFGCGQRPDQPLGVKTDGLARDLRINRSGVIAVFSARIRNEAVHIAPGRKHDLGVTQGGGRKIVVDGQKMQGSLGVLRHVIKIVGLSLGLVAQGEFQRRKQG